MVKLTRCTNEPILRPLLHHPWERAAVFNCGACLRDGVVYLLYRAADHPFNDASRQSVSSFGYAVSTDGINFFRFDKPVLQGQGPQEACGVEDPRITLIGDTYYVLYTAFGGRKPDDFRISMATTKNFLTWERHGVVLDEPNKDAALFPEKIGGRYVLLHRRPPAIWMAFSDDMRNWTDHTVVMDVVECSWDSWRIGIAGPPIKTDQGWLLIYHGVDHKRVYRLGIAMLDLKDPTKVIARQREPILEPELDWEVNGLVPNVVFSCGAVDMGSRYLVYYGGADTVIGVAYLNKSDLSF
ncbi:MAG: glycoside hydrolase family 130 protein [Armatimonadota bacterium]